MKKADALKDINETQDFYVDRLIELINGQDEVVSSLKEIDFTSPTGTGKTVMMAKLINKMPEIFFIITSLSKGQLNQQINDGISKLAIFKNYYVFGSSQLTTVSVLTGKDVLNLLPRGKKVVWIRDEGHIATNRWMETLEKSVYCIVNFSATNKTSNGIQCNFAHTMMLRTVSQFEGSPEDALDKLLEIKESHSKVKNYNPCALFRIVRDTRVENIIDACKARGLSYIDITDDDYRIKDLCEDDNSYDVIINKLKITEGIDLRRCHVIYIDNVPKNEATVVQVIGRARRNALFWRDDIDILDPLNEQLLNDTRRCFVFYRDSEAQALQTETGELAYSLCDVVSVQALKPNTDVEVTNGVMTNGLKVLELEGKTGIFRVKIDEEYNENIVDNPDFYAERFENRNPYILDFSQEPFSIKKIQLKENVRDCFISKPSSAYCWTRDSYKEEFYIIRHYSLQEGIEFDADFWGRYLNVDKKSKKVNPSKFKEFQQQPFYNECLYWVINYRCRDLNEDEKEILQKAIDFGKRAEDDSKEEYKEVFVSEKNHKGSFVINPDLIPYVERIWYIDCSEYEEIKNLCKPFNDVKVLGINRFKVANHPFSDYFIGKGFKNISDLKKYVFSCNSAQVMGVLLDYWEKMFKTVRKISDIDGYDTKTVDLETLVFLKKIKLSEQEIARYSSWTANIKCVDGKRYQNHRIYCVRGQDFAPFKNDLKYYLFNDSFDNQYEPFQRTSNDREMAIIGPESMRLSSFGFVENKPITSKIDNYCKFSRFIKKRYNKYLEEYKPQTFSGKNNFDFDRKANSCLGFCVEYFAKIKLFGDKMFEAYLNEAAMEAKAEKNIDVLRVRAAMLIYRKEMISCYGAGAGRNVPSLSVEVLNSPEYITFVNTVIGLGNKTKDFLLAKLYGGTIDEHTKFYDPNLSVDHLAALCDFITEDTIVDIKCTSEISTLHLMQVLSYHYLSTKRSDLHINRLIVYEAVTGRYVEIKL